MNNFLTKVGITGLTVGGILLANKILNKNKINLDISIDFELDEIVKCFISVPISGRNDEDILKDIYEAQLDAEKKIKEEKPNALIIFKDGFSFNSNENNPVYLLGEAICNLSDCEYVYFCSNWDRSKGCKIENEVSLKYDKKILLSI